MTFHPPLTTGAGFAVLEDDAYRWGVLGAAGLLLRAPDADGRPLVLMQHRSAWTNLGDTWGLPGGAIEPGESVAEGALRETFEETGVRPENVRVRGSVVTATMPTTAYLVRRPLPEGATEETPGVRRSPLNGLYLEERVPAEEPWTYTTVIGDLPEPVDLILDAESVELRWVPEDALTDLLLLPPFAAVWEQLRARPTRVQLTSPAPTSAPTATPTAPPVLSLAEARAELRHTVRHYDGAWWWITDVVACEDPYPYPEGESTADATLSGRDGQILQLTDLGDIASPAGGERSTTEE